MKPQAGSGESPAAAQADHGVPQSDRGSQDSQQTDVKESLDEAEKAAGRREVPDSEQLGEEQAPSSDTRSVAEEGGTRGLSGEQAAEGHPSTPGPVETLGKLVPPPEGGVRAHAAYTEQHLANQVQGLHLSAPRVASEARLVAPPAAHPVALGSAPQQAASQTSVFPAAQPLPLPQSAALFPPASAPSPVPEAVVGWQAACQLLQRLPPGSWPAPALLVSFLRHQGLAQPQRTASGHFRHRVVPVTRVGQALLERGGPTQSGRTAGSGIPQRAQQGQPAAQSVVLAMQAGTAKSVDERVEVAQSGGLQSGRLRPFLGIDLEKLPEGEENVDKMDTPRGEANDATESGDTSQGRSERKEKSASDELGQMTGSTDAPFGERGGAPGRKSQEGVNQNEQEEKTEGGRKEAVEGGRHENLHSTSWQRSASEVPRKVEGDSAAAAKRGGGEPARDAGEHAPEAGAMADPPEERALRNKGETEEKALETGDRGGTSDAVGQQGDAERVGDKKGDRLRGGTRAEGPVMGAGPMEWRHEKLGGKHWQEPGRHGGKERVSWEDAPKRKARDFGFAHQDVFKIRRRTLHEGGLMASARSDLSLLDQLVGSSEQSGDRAPPGQDLPGGAGQAGRGPYQCKLCGAVFAYAQALGGHMRSHRQYIAPPQPPPDPFQLPRPPPSQLHSVVVGARSSGGSQMQADSIGAALQALNTPTLSLGSEVGYNNFQQNNDIALGLAQAGDPGTALGRPERERPPALVNQTEIRPTASNLQHGSPHTGPLNTPERLSGADALLPSRVPSPTSPIFFLPGQGAFPGGWFELEAVDIEHPERIPPLSIGGSPRLVAEQILEALVGYPTNNQPGHAERPTTAAVQPALSEAGASALFSLYEPLSSVEQAGILDRVRGQQTEESRAGGWLANLAATGAQPEQQPVGSRRQSAWGLQVSTSVR